MGIRRGSTPSHKFTLPFDVPPGSFLKVVYAQANVKDGNPQFLFEKTTESCSVEGRTIAVKLTAEETLMFDCTPHFLHGRYAPAPVFIQVGVETSTGEKSWSNIIETTVETCLRKDGVIRNV